MVRLASIGGRTQVSCAMKLHTHSSQCDGASRTLPDSLIHAFVAEGAYGAIVGERVEARRRSPGWWLVFCLASVVPCM